MNRRLLIVDADTSHRRRVREMAESVGLEVEEIERAEQLVDAVAKTAPAVVLIDLDQDTMAAFSAADAIQAVPAGADIQILGMSARSTVEQTAGATEHAFEDFVSKPARAGELLPILRFHFGLPHGLNDAHPS